MCVSLSVHKIARIFSKRVSVRCLEWVITPKGSFMNIPSTSKNFFTSASALSRVKTSDKENVVSDYRQNGVANLFDVGTLSTILKEKRYRWILEIEQGLLKEKNNLIKGMNFKQAEHSFPFYKLSLQALLSILKSIRTDERNNFCKNRLYYLSEHLQCDPLVLSIYLSKRTFIYTLPFAWLKQSLMVLLEMGVPPERIVKDLWVIKYHHETIRKRLEIVKTSGREELVPWMVRCPEDVLQRSIQLSQNTKTILGENRSTQAYLAERLKTSPDVIGVMYSKIPSVETIRVTKAKSCLDFLFAEGFTEEDIINVPRILAHSLKTIKSRLAQLRAIGVESKNLNILCKSKKDFKKYCDAFLFHVSKGKAQ